MTVKRTGCVLLACLLAGLGCFAAFKHNVLAQKLDEWYLLRRPERFTQLYFDDYRQLPAALQVGTSHIIAFTVRNVEHRVTTYHYHLSAKDPQTGSVYLLGRGSLRLDHDELTTVHKTVVLPPFDSQRIGLEVNLTYKGIKFGDSLPTSQSLSIWHWTPAVRPITNKDRR